MVPVREKDISALERIAEVIRAQVPVELTTIGIG
jgi:hypothetical protein